MYSDSENKSLGFSSDNTSDNNSFPPNNLNFGEGTPDMHSFIGQKPRELENGNNNEINNLETINKNKENQKNNPLNILSNTFFTSINNVNNATKKKEKKKRKIFKIGKQGRNKKNKKYTKEKQHNKFEINNIIMKIKRKVLNNSVEYINKKLKKNEKMKGIKLKKIEKSIIAVCEKQQNLNLLETKLKDLLSNELSSKYTTIKDKKNFNKEQIDKILKKDDPELNEILNKTLNDMINLYVQEKVENDLYEGFSRIEDDKKEIISMYENDGEDYFNKYKEIAQKLKQIFIERKSNKKK